MADLRLKTDVNLPLRDLVFLTLREAILKGVLQPGERLMEIGLANQLGVSRTPIREAIRKLELEGLVVMKPRKGAEVASITLDDVNSVLEVRKHLEKLVVELACKRATAEDIERIKERQVEFEESIKQGSLTDMAESDSAFHTAIYESTDNKRLIQILNNLYEQMYRYRLEHIKDDDRRSRLVEEHDALVKAIEKGDVEEATEIISGHINSQQTVIVNHVNDVRRK